MLDWLKIATSVLYLAIMFLLLKWLQKWPSVLFYDRINMPIILVCSCPLSTPELNTKVFHFMWRRVVPCVMQWRWIPLSVGVILRPKSACLAARPTATKQQQQHHRFPDLVLFPSAVRHNSTKNPPSVKRFTTTLWHYYSYSIYFSAVYPQEDNYRLTACRWRWATCIMVVCQPDCGM